jgi:hypothetical protein
VKIANTRSEFYFEDVYEQEAGPNPTWLIPDAIPSDGEIAIYGPGAMTFAQALVHALRLAGKPARLFDARMLAATDLPDASETACVFAVPSDTSARMMRLLCDGADCLLRAFDGMTAEVQYLRDGPDPEGKIVSLRSLT